MTTSNDPIDPIPSVTVNPDTLAMPVFPSLTRITRNDSVGTVASNRQEKSLERRTDTLAAKINALIDAHNLNAVNATSVFLKRAGGSVNAMTGDLHLGSHRIRDTLYGLIGTDVAVLGQSLNTKGTADVGGLVAGTYWDARNGEVRNAADGTTPTSLVTKQQMEAVLGGAATITEMTIDSAFGVTLSSSGAGFTFTVPTGVTSLLFRGRSGGGGGGGGGGWATAHDAPDDATAGGTTLLEDVTAALTLLSIPGGGRGGPGQGDDTGTASFAGAAPGPTVVGAGVSVTSDSATAGSPGGSGTVTTGGNGGTGGGRGGDGGFPGDSGGGGGGGGYRYVTATVTVTPGHVIKLTAGLRGEGGSPSAGGGDPGSDGAPGTVFIAFGMLATVA